MPLFRVTVSTSGKDDFQTVVVRAADEQTAVEIAFAKFDRDSDTDASRYAEVDALPEGEKVDDVVDSEVFSLLNTIAEREKARRT